MEMCNQWLSCNHWCHSNTPQVWVVTICTIRETEHEPNKHYQSHGSQTDRSHVAILWKWNIRVNTIVINHRLKWILSSYIFLQQTYRLIQWLFFFSLKYTLIRKRWLKTYHHRNTRVTVTPFSIPIYIKMGVFLKCVDDLFTLSKIKIF